MDAEESEEIDEVRSRGSRGSSRSREAGVTSIIDGLLDSVSLIKVDEHDNHQKRILMRLKRKGKRKK